MLWSSVNKIHETSTAVKLSKENSGVGLRLRGFDPLKTRPDATTFAAAFSKNSTTIATHTHFYFGKYREKRRLYMFMS